MLEINSSKRDRFLLELESPIVFKFADSLLHISHRKLVPKYVLANFERNNILSFLSYLTSE